MARTNPKTSDHRIDRDAVRLAGGFGAPAAKQDAEKLLRRVVLANLLWEDVAYQDGASIVDQIRTLVPQVQPEIVQEIAVEARNEQHLRHVPLLLARELARHPTHRKGLDHLLPRIIRRPDELTEFMSLYWLDDPDQPIAAAVKRGLANAFGSFNEYQLAKYNQQREIKLRDVMFLVHPTPRDDVQAEVFKRLAENRLVTPDTWEVALSTGSDKRETWERLIADGKLGALAFLRNLRNMQEVGVSPSVIREGFKNLSTERLLPLNFFGAAKAAPDWVPEIETAMLKSLNEVPKLPGVTHLIVDVSGSMFSPVSRKSMFNRLDAAAAMTVIAREICEHVTVWATAGNDYTRTHKTERLQADRGFALAKQVVEASAELGGGGIFTRQCLEYIKGQVGDDVGDRTIVFSDSQDCDYGPGRTVPKPFSPRNYIVDISAHTHGVAYDGVWTAEVSGWSEHFLKYISALEASEINGGNT